MDQHHIEVGHAVVGGGGRGAAEAAARQAFAAVRRFPPRCVLVFATVTLDLPEILAGVAAVAGDVPLIGASALAGAGDAVRASGRDAVRKAMLRAGISQPAVAVVAACALRDVRDGSRRIRDVVRDLKVFSRGDDDAHAPVDVRRVLESTLKMAANEIRHRARLVTALEPVPPVTASESRLGQVFLNLFINAAQAIPPGSADRHEIAVRTRTDARGRAVIEVSDSGAGIPQDSRERIFEPFYTTKPRGIGTGLGLAICRNIVSAAGGEIAVSSEVGRGSTFTIVLPPCEAARPRPDTAAAATTRPARVLAIDDEPPVLTAIRRMLGRDHVVVAETSARAALARLTSGERFDVVLCDVMMPQMTGPDFHAAVAAEVPTEARRIVFLTGGAFTPATKAFLDGVPNRRMEKPFDADQLRRVVAAAA